MWSGSGAAQVSALRLDEPASVNDKVTPARLCVNQPPCIGVAKLASSLQATGHHFFRLCTAWESPHIVCMCV